MLTVHKTKRANLKIEVIRPFWLITGEANPETGLRYAPRRAVKVGETIEVDSEFGFEMIDGGKAILAENRKTV